MDGNLNIIMLPFLDIETKVHYLNYHLCKALHEAVDANLGEDHEQKYDYTLECLYEWWEFEQREMLNN